MVVKGVLLGSEMLRNIHHYSFPDYVPGDSAKQSFVDEFDQNMKTRFQALYSDEVSIASYGLRRVDSASQPEDDIVPTNGAWDGTATASLLPTQSSALITWKAFTTFPRSTRSYLFPFTQAALEVSGLITSAAITSMTAYGGDILEIVIPGQNNAVKVAVKYTGDPRTVTSENVVTAVFTNSNWATQRGRRRGVGA